MKKSLERTKAKAHGMTVTELRAHLKKVKKQKLEHKKALRKKEREEKAKFEEWKIKEKYKKKRKAVKSGEGIGLVGALEMLGGKSNAGNSDPLGLFSSPKPSGKKRKKKRKK